MLRREQGSGVGRRRVYSCSGIHRQISMEIRKLGGLGSQFHEPDLLSQLKREGEGSSRLCHMAAHDGLYTRPVLSLALWKSVTRLGRGAVFI